MRPGQYFISTHAFTEGDGIACINANRLKYFNSRLHGRRQFFSHIRHSASLFQLTPSRKATRSRATTMSKSEISTHAFTEGDSWEKSQKKRTAHFNSRLHGRRLSSNRLSSRERYFNSRLHGRRLQIQIIFAAKHFLFLLILSKFLILAFLFHLASLRFSLHPVIFPVRISLYFSVYLPFALETCTLCHNI